MLKSQKSEKVRTQSSMRHQNSDCLSNLSVNYEHGTKERHTMQAGTGLNYGSQSQYNDLESDGLR